MDFGPGAEPENELLRTDRWSIRAVFDTKRIFFYVSEINNVYYSNYCHCSSCHNHDDEPLDDIFSWYNYDEPIFLFGDYHGLPKSLIGKKVYKQSCHKDDTSSAFYYQVVINMEPKCILDCKYLFCFQGSLITHPVRYKIPHIFEKSDRGLLQTNYTFFWMYPMKDRPALRAKFLDGLNDSQFILCPRGAGLSSIRFFETLRMGRIPVLIADDTKLPLEYKIDYSKFIVRVPEHDIENTLDYIDQFGKMHDLFEASILARQVSLHYFEDIDRFLQEDISYPASK